MAVAAMRIVIVGANGGIGSALLAHYHERFPDAAIFACGRQAPAQTLPRVTPLLLDLCDEDSIARAARQAAAAGPLDRVLVCTGVLHDAQQRPEKSLRELDAAWLQHNFAINSIGPALVLKHFLPLLRRDAHSVCALLSARVGSISDNRLGGWYSYRASKAALNMLIATAAVELRRSHPAAALLGLHPGTVDTALSAPFQARLRAGQLQSPQQAAVALLRLVESADLSLSGRCLAWDGQIVPP